MHVHVYMYTYVHQAAPRIRHTASESHQIAYDRFHKRCYNPNIHKSRNSDFLVQIQIKPKYQSEFAPRDTENLSFSICWISGVKHFQWKLS